MARVNVYLPDELAEKAKRAGISVSAWLDSLDWSSGVDVDHDSVLKALDEAREEFGARVRT